MKRLLCLLIGTAAWAGTVRAEGLRADTALVRTHLHALTGTDGYRNFLNTAALDATAGYIRGIFAQYADTVFYQPYEVQGRIYRNVVARFGTHIAKPVVVVGAHYDVCGDQQGADDNASGVVALLELSRMLPGATLTRPIELVAYTLEEPPFFRTPYMGSNVHAQSLRTAGTPVYGMVAVEMIGYFSDAPRSQDYPIGPMKVFYGRTGNYILLVKRSGYGSFVRAFCAQFDSADEVDDLPDAGLHCAGGAAEAAGYAANNAPDPALLPEVPVRGLKAPAKIQGIDFSDHLNYWNAGYDAMMVTNTAFFRNKNYHRATDTVETLDIPRMTRVIDDLARALADIDCPGGTAKKFYKSTK